MKKLLLLGFFLLLCSLYLSAQNTVSGTVTDKKGNPIPGAKVEIKGGTESTITELMVRLRWKQNTCTEGESLLCGYAVEGAEGKTEYAYKNV